HIRGRRQHWQARRFELGHVRRALAEPTGDPAAQEEDVGRLAAGDLLGTPLFSFCRFPPFLFLYGPPPRPPRLPRPLPPLRRFRPLAPPRRGGLPVRGARGPFPRRRCESRRAAPA